MDSSLRGTLMWIAGGVALIAAMATAGVATAWISSDGEGPSARASIDLDGLPDMPADTRAAYEAAPSHRELFAHLPCYCGCGLLKEPHGSLDRCFLLPDGKAEAHASGCKICTDIATQALAMEAQGLDHATIRARVDEQFARAGPPTDTPLP
ncbi:MAG: hypothetical protein EPO22_04530 [Dehalococcoidia bacterium]|nr:MAG: hypothetical protein EPO22_04530 [Dehalococcoidia bacterium]